MKTAALIIALIAFGLIVYVFAKAQQPSPAPAIIVRVNETDAARVNDLLKQIADLQKEVSISLLHAKAVSVDRREASLAELDSAQVERDDKGLVWKFSRAQAKTSPK